MKSAASPRSCVLPLKKAVRTEEQLAVGDTVRFAIDVAPE